VTITSKRGDKQEMPDGTVIERKVYFVRRHTIVDLKNFEVLKKIDALVFICLMIIRIYITDALVISK
jgi:hypothetical protein